MTSLKILADHPFSTTSLLWKPRPDAWVLTVICKATFTLLPGDCRPAHAPDPPNDVDDHWNDDPHRSLHAASDLVPFKRKADVVLVGHAYAPRAQAVSSLVARLIVAGVDKTIEVHADRTWAPDGQLREGARFTRMPLRWERAAGGADTTNPVGVRPDAPPDAYGKAPVPNLQPPGTYVGWRDDVIPPIGFGPIAAWWPARRDLLHRHAATWDPASWTQRPFPHDVDAAFFNVAPPDQQVDEIRADGRIVLENLHPEHARLVTRLPGLAPLAVVEREAASGPQPVRMRCDTLSIDTDRCVCHLVWRGQIALTHPDERGRVTITAEPSRREEIDETIAPGLSGPALPFGGGGLPASGDASETLFINPAAAPGAALPFQEKHSPWAKIPVAPPRETPVPRAEDDGTGTIFGALSASETLPFLVPGPAESKPPVAPESPAVRPPEPVHALPPEPSSWAIPEVERVPERPLHFALSNKGIQDVLAIPTSPPSPVQPPMLGVPVASVQTTDSLPREEAPFRTAAAPVVELVPAAPVEPEPEPVEIPIAQAATIAAEIAEGKASRADVLRDHDLGERAWVVNERRWSKAIDDEASEGSSRLRTEYDRAYVAAVERFRGPITLAEYARIVIGLERGRVNQVLDDLKIQRPASMRIVRLWTKKVATDAKLGEEAKGVFARLRAP